MTVDYRANLLEVLDATRRDGALLREEYDAPRGNLQSAAHSRFKDLRPYTKLLYNQSDDRIMIAALEVIGEYGTNDDVDTLVMYTYDRRPEVRSVAIWALATIGGPKAVSTLWFILNHEPSNWRPGQYPDDDTRTDDRIKALRGLLHLLTGGWDKYMMTNDSVELPKEWREAFEFFRSEDTRVQNSVKQALNCFEETQ